MKQILLFFQLFNTRRVKISATTQPNKLTTEHVNFRIILNDSAITIDFHCIHHGRTSLFFLTSYVRLPQTPLSAFGLGCGLMKTRTSSNKNAITRDHSRSSTPAPMARNSDSISRHFILALTG